ncbi:hypothetical protein GMORB2_7334 [Geosmithia morbida]|uniref:Uncharacterized protein n=1 Tax=Geosmithia morbida TaxID=1094350 RepID=A0A9P5D144_9HYPO|nr:uncharacterized protein GMORB2_7334 [Geosmithia morbida]KAF4122342.1 hypothetical protein GMORB2_7334 [Geosmithia morbida]
MRTRKSNTTKRYTVDEYVSGGSEASGEDADARVGPSRRQRKADKRDGSFDGDDDREQSPDPDADAIAASESDAFVNADPAPHGRSQRQQRRRPKPVKAVAKSVGGDEKGHDAAIAYLDLEPFIADTHVPRGYAGTFERHLRGAALADTWYGPEDCDIETALRLVERWLDWPLLPPREPVPGPDAVPVDTWEHGASEREAEHARRWLERWSADRPEGSILRPLDEQESAPYQLRPGTLPVLMGPHNAQGEFPMGPGTSRLLSHMGVPIAENECETADASGWMLDAGGIVLSLDWAHHQSVDSPQHLALAVIPFGDQQNYNYQEESSKSDFQAYGTVQIWEFCGKQEGAYIYPAPQLPKLLKTLCLDSGRARRVKWAPSYQHLAVLTNTRVEQASVSLRLPGDIKPTAMTWVGLNRLAVGYSDGCTVLWSMHPCCVLSRQMTHHSAIVDMTSGYPTFPYLVASVPVGGHVKLVDMRNPSCETTEFPTLSVSTTPNLLSWSHHLKGFFAMMPSSNVLSTMVGFMHHAYFPIPRRTFASDSFTTCLDVGRTHPFLLVGSADGSLAALNPQFDLFQVLQGRRESSDRIRIFQHEHRPAEHFPASSGAAQRGVSRILHGFLPEKNRKARVDGKRAPAKPPPKKKKRAEDDDAGDQQDGGGDDSEEAAGSVDPTRVIVHEPGTRITAVQWNPNEAYGCWAAAATASGLVKIMDLGLDREYGD